MGRDLERMSNQSTIKNKVSVIVPCFNSGFYIVRTIYSLIAQTYKNLEIIIVNDGTTDEVTINILNHFKFKNLKIINQKNKGLASARNKGILHSKSEFVIFLDSDDWLTTDAIDKYVNFLTKNKDTTYVYSNIVNKNQNNSILRKNFNYFEQLFTNQIPYSILIRRAAFKKVGMYDENMPIMGFEDWDLNIRLGKEGFYGNCLDENLFNYNFSDEGMLQTLSRKNYSLLYNYIRNKNLKLYKFKSLFNIYKKFYKKKSTHYLFLYFIYNFLYKVFNKKSFNKLFNILYLFFAASKNQNSKKKFFYSKFKVKKIAHIITGLEVGGAEKALISLLLAKKKLENKDFVICLGSKGTLSQILLKNKIRIFHLNMDSNKLNFFKIIELFKILKKEKPDLIQSWMYHADLLASILAPFLNIRTIWTIHNYDVSFRALGFKTRLVVFLCSIFSYFIPHKIITVSKAAIEKHVKSGYTSKKFIHIPLGYRKRKNKVFPKTEKKKIIFGSLSRWNVQKNHLFMIKAFGKFKKNNKKIKFNLYLGGKDLDYKNKKLTNLIKENDLIKEVNLLGNVTDIENFFTNIDVHLLTSTGEAFPNVVCESMSYGTPCISTNVGDVGNILAETGWLFQVNDYPHFESTLLSVCEELKNKKIWNVRKKLCKERITNNFSIDTMIGLYYSAWNSNLGTKNS